MKWHATHSLTCMWTSPYLGQKEKLKWDTPPSKQFSYAHTYLVIQYLKYHPCRLQIWAGCSFILIIFKTKFCTPLLCWSQAPTTTTFCAVPVLCYYGYPCVCVHVYIYKKAAIQVICFISKPRYSQMAESENMSKPSRWATASQLGQKYNQQLLWQQTTDKPLSLQATKVEVYPIFLTESMSQKLESIYWRGAICSRICSSNLATSYGINKRKS